MNVLTDVLLLLAVILGAFTVIEPAEARLAWPRWTVVMVICALAVIAEVLLR